jgi:hypothetical protein
MAIEFNIANEDLATTDLAYELMMGVGNGS